MEGFVDAMLYCRRKSGSKPSKEEKMAERKTTSRTKRKDSDGRVLKKGERQIGRGKGYEYRYTDRFGKRQSIYGSTLDELREKIEDSKHQKELVITNDARKMTMNNLYALWKSVKRGLKESTFHNYQYMYEKFAMNEIGNAKILELKRSDIKAFYNQLYENGMKAATIDNVHSVIHQMLELAVDDDIIRFNPSDKALKELMSEHARESKKVSALTAEEEVLFASYLRTSNEHRHWYPIFIVMMMAGLRVGEVTALQWEDIDFENDYIRVNKTLVNYRNMDDHKCHLVMNKTKTRAGERKVEMISMVKEAFELEKQYQESHGISCAANVEGYDDFVFLNRFGLTYAQTTLNAALKRIVSDCNEQVLDNAKPGTKPLLLPSIHCHMLRHTFGTRLNEANINIKAMQALLGHSDIETTMQIYVDASKKIMKRATDDYEKLMKEMFEAGNADKE